MASRCICGDHPLRNVKLLPTDQLEAWQTVPEFPQRQRDRISDLRQISRPDIFQILSPQHVCQDRITVPESIQNAFRKHMRKNLRQNENLLKERYHQPTGGSMAGSSHLPPEIVAMIVKAYLRQPIGLSVNIWTQSRPGQVTWKNCRMHTSYEQPVCMRESWCLIESIPLFHVSISFRRILLELLKRWANWKKCLRFTARISFTGDERFPWYRTGIRHWEHRHDLHSALTVRVTQLHFDVVWSWEEERLTTPLSDIIRFADKFERFRFILVNCIVCFHGVEPRPSIKELARSLYGPRGIYHQISTHLSSFVDALAWSYGTERSGILPGYCLLPNCDSRRKAIGLCMHTNPRLASRVLNIQLSLIPQLTFRDRGIGAKLWVRWC